MYVLGLKCRECGRKYPKKALYVCDYCFGPLEVDYDYQKIKESFVSGKLAKEKITHRAKNLWRYKELLPLDKEPTDGLHSGFTPLVKAERLAKVLGLRELYIKDDSVCHPTLSFKDRVVAVALSKAKELGFNTVACASTGNLANAVSAQAAIAGLKSVIFIPADLELGKIIGSLVYHPVVVGVEGNYDQVNRLCTEIAQKYNWAFVNINIRPYYAEGSKTYAFEIIEQLGWRAPENIIVPVAGGSLISKIGKALKEFIQLGIIDSKIKTKIYAAQAKGSAPVVTAVKDKRAIIKPVKPKTIAKSLAIGNPADGYYAVRTVLDSGGWAEEATDSEIVEGIKLLAQTEGIFTETAGGVTVAVTKKLISQGKIKRNESVVISITGNGLKTYEVLQERVGKLIKIKPNIHSFEKTVRNFSGRKKLWE